MASREARFFLRRKEFLDILEDLVAELGLVLIESRPQERCLVERSVDELRTDAQFRVELARTAPVDEILSGVADGRSITPGKWGWISADLPIERGDVLFQSGLHAKSAWVDDAGEAYDNPAAIQLFDEVAKPFRRAVKGSVWLGGSSAGPPRQVRQVCYSRGAEEWWRGGGRLRQLGVENSEFSVEDPRSSS